MLLLCRLPGAGLAVVVGGGQWAHGAGRRVVGVCNLFAPSLWFRMIDWKSLTKCYICHKF